MSRALFLTKRQKSKTRNAFANNMSTRIKLIKVQLSNITQSVRFLGDSLGTLTAPLIKITFPLARNVEALLATMASAFAIDGSIQGKICGRGIVEEQKKVSVSPF